MARAGAVAGCAAVGARVGWMRVQMRWHARAQSGAAKLAVTDEEEEAAAVDVVVVVVWCCVWFFFSFFPQHV